MTSKVQRRGLNRWLVSGAGSRLVVVILFLHMLLLGLTQLVTPLYSLTLGASQVALGIVVGAFGVAGILLSILSGALSDHFGRRQMISISFVFWIGAGAVSLLAPPVLWLVCGQILVGVADLCLWVAAMTYLTEIAPQGKHAELLSLGTGMMGLGLMVGPAVGGLVGRHLILGIQPAFILVVLLGILGLILSYRLSSTRLSALERGGFRRQVRLSHRGAFVLVGRNRSVRMAMSVMMLGTASWMAVGRSFYLVYMNRLGFSTELIGLLSTLRAGAMTLAQFSFAFLASHLGAMVTMLSGVAVGGLALMLTPWLTTAPALALVGCVGSGADRLRNPGMFTMIAEGTDQDSRALAVALLNVAWATTQTVFPPVLGMIVERTTLSVSFLLVGALVAFFSVVLYVWNRRVEVA